MYGKQLFGRKHSLSGASAPIIVWFREDLRLSDNPALHAAVQQDCPVLCVYIHADGCEGTRPLGGASLWWLDKSLRALSEDLEQLGGRLTIRAGDGSACLDELIEETGAKAVYWNRRYGKAERDIDAAIKSRLKDRDIDVQSFNGRLLVEPWVLKTGSGGFYKVFTPFWKALRDCYSPPAALPRPSSVKGPQPDTLKVSDLGLHPTKPDWSTGFDAVWTPGEAGAHARLKDFLEGPVDTYPDDRDLPGKEDGTSGLSPHLRFGEIGPAQIWRATIAAMEAENIQDAGGWKFLSEVAWREFSYVLLYYRPDLADENYNDDFNHMPWRTDKDALKSWQSGQTGYPIVDAGMRQLWETGWMHNRVRMIVASFLTKHLLLHWRHGEDWFWDTLVDADPASNPASWQWTAGSGADATPYFRVFNPITQGQKFDADGAYVRRWCPELAKLPDKVLHEPWAADDATLNRAGVKLGTDYPHPLVAHKAGRERALEAYETLKSQRTSK
ncbi:cryptochrome/photolyase family protein [Hyphomonas jannaschiana]|uniref:Deoxyribodipyrimidine photo-lyase n=1 Tax=Hyphomonas jannaschiana VP2 TaxID=1280952 RepID=A0A059FB30_9PROT|nr:deoxyribodipyrimidine photo-lyase [Hyphomonas jannaschiana]KCZ87761.1 deoxyribodipyrimidine photolyase family protein [Hyphomonas jannaschiana VP2]